MKIYKVISSLYHTDESLERHLNELSNLGWKLFSVDGTHDRVIFVKEKDRKEIK